MTAPVAAITGGTGFLGRNIVIALAEAGWRIRLLTRSTPMHPLLANIPLEVVLGDLENSNALRQLVQGASAIIHAAGLVKAPSMQKFFEVNRDGTRALAAAAVQHAPQARFILISSQAAREPHLSAYAASKRAGEVALATALSSSLWTVLRPCVIYGPWDHEGIALLRLANRRLAPIVARPEPRIAMIHVRDAAAAVAALLTDRTYNSRGETYEISDHRDAGYTMTELLQTAGAALGHRPVCIPIPDLLLRLAGGGSDAIRVVTGRVSIFGRGKVREILHRNWQADPSKQLPPEFWTPRIKLETGLRETIAWWRIYKSQAVSRPFR